LTNAIQAFQGLLDPVRSKWAMHTVNLDNGLLHLRKRWNDAEHQQCEPKQVFPVHVVPPTV